MCDLHHQQQAAKLGKLSNPVTLEPDSVDGLATNRLQQWSAGDIVSPVIADSLSCCRSSVSMCLHRCLQVGEAVDMIRSSEASELHSRLLFKADVMQTAAASFALAALPHASMCCCVVLVGT